MVVGIAYRIDEGLGLVLEVWDGVITVDEWRTHVATILADPGRARCTKFLTDLTTADTSTIADSDRAEIASIFASDPSNFAGTKTAAIASQEFEPSVRFGRRIEESGLNVIVFNELNGACLWLGLDTTAMRANLREMRTTLRDEGPE
jgi:hypothetical protein